MALRPFLNAGRGCGGVAAEHRYVPPDAPKRIQVSTLVAFIGWANRTFGRPSDGTGSCSVEFVDGNLRRSENMFERARGNGVLTMQRNHRISLRVVSVPYEHMAAALPHANEPEAFQFLQQLSRRQTGQRRHEVS
jgi:hypothetical protein